MKRSAALLLVLFLLLSGCGKEETSGTENGEPWLSFTDSTGRTVRLDKKPERVAVLFSSFADIWVTAGGTVDITVGESIERGFAPASAVLVDEGSGHSTIDLERLTSENPDLVIGTADYACQAEACEFASSVGIPAALFRVEDVDDYLKVLRICCSITERDDLYEEYGTAVKAECDAILSASGASDMDILFIRAGSSAKSTKAKNGDENFVCRMLDELGTHNIADTEKALLDGLSMEAILAAQPEHIFITTMGNEDAATEQITELFSEAGWKDLEAVKSGCFTFLPKDLFHYKPNSRWAEAYKYLSDILEQSN